MSSTPIAIFFGNFNIEIRRTHLWQHRNIMASVRLKIGLRFIVICLLLHCTYADRSTQRKEELIQDTVRRFLGVKSDERTAVPIKPQSLPPRYMMDLYEKYRSGQTPMQGNTVRSILAMREELQDPGTPLTNQDELETIYKTTRQAIFQNSLQESAELEQLRQDYTFLSPSVCYIANNSFHKIGGKDMLVFNLTGLKSTEQILQSKLYLLKRRKPKGGKKRELSHFRLNIGCLPNTTSKHHIDISLARQKPEWHSYDISESVVSCRQARKGKESLLGLTLEVKRSKGNHRLIAFKRLIKPNSQPFVLIFSEDSQNRTVSVPASTSQRVYEEIGDLLRARANEDGFLPEGYRFPQLTNRTHHHHHHHRGRRSSENAKFFIGPKSKLQTNQNNPSLPYHIKYSTSNSDEYIQKYLSAISENFNLNKNIRSDIVRSLRHIIDSVRYSLNVNKPIHYMNETENSFVTEIHSTNNSTRPMLLQDQQVNLTDSKLFQKVLFPAVKQKFHEQNSNNHNDQKTVITKLRSKRGIYDTLLYSTEVKDTNTSESTVKTIRVFDKNHLGNQESDIFPKPRRRNGRRKDHKPPRRHKKKRRRNRKLPFWWTRHDSRLHSQDVKQMCQRKSLTVEFSQLGWDEWIIAPKSFNAYYCAGSCTFPIIKHTETSNHAVVQSLINAMGLNKEIPTPCCVPSVTKPLDLLYFDERGNLTIKTYPNMIVEKCSCR